MALGHSVNIVTNGLIFAYDMSNTQKSWRGQPTTNLQVPNIIDWGGDARVFLLPTTKSPIGTPAYIVQDNNSGSYLSRSRNITVPNNSNTYTISIYIKKTSGAVSARLGFNCGFTGGTTPVQTNPRFNSDTGSGTGTSDDEGDWWRWKFSITNNSTGNTTLYCSFYPATGFYNSGDNSAAIGSAIVSSIQIEQNTFATPFVFDSRSSTQAILDLTNNSTITANNLTYNSDGTFSFNGTSNFLSFTIPSTYSNYTISLWVRLNSLSGDQRWFSNANNGTFTVRYSSGWFFHFNPLAGTPPSTSTSGSSLATVGLWYNVVATNDASNSTSGARLYVNGTLIGTAIPAVSLQSTGERIGSREGTTAFGNGSCSLVSIYNRVLSAAEISTNFNALRGRYGL